MSPDRELCTFALPSSINGAMDAVLPVAPRSIMALVHFYGAQKNMLALHEYPLYSWADKGMGKRSTLHCRLFFCQIAYIAVLCGVAKAHATNAHATSSRSGVMQSTRLLRSNSRQRVRCIIWYQLGTKCLSMEMLSIACPAVRTRGQPKSKKEISDLL